MRTVILALCAIVAVIVISAIVVPALFAPAYASLSPKEVVVVYNSSPAFNDSKGRNVSKAVADYYCSQRGIPTANEVGIFVPSQPGSSPEQVDPAWFHQYIISDQYDRQGHVLHTGLKTFLSSRPGFDPKSPATDPTKAIVLCYGIPIKIHSPERAGAVDSTLTLLFNTAEWGLKPIGSYAAPCAITNPYYDASADPAKRTKPTDFGKFRASASNTITVNAPAFTICRMFDNTHAIAGGLSGLLYTGAYSKGTWTWAAVPDENKAFIAYDITDISVADSRHAWISTQGGTVISSADGGHSWTAIRSGNYPVVGVSPYGADDGWMVETDKGHSYVQVYHSKTGPGPEISLPTGFVAASIAGANAAHAWVSGSSGILSTSDGGTSWTPQYSTGPIGRIWVKNKIGWALTGAGALLQTTDGTTWTPAEAPSIIGADLAVYDAKHAVVSGTNSGSWYYDGNYWTADKQGLASVAWAGANAVGVVPTMLAAANGSPGAFQWATSHTVPVANWKMRYLVCRLDGLSAPVDTATGIPIDVKNLIDNAISSETQASRNALRGGKYIVDQSSKAWTVSAHLAYDPSFVPTLRRFVGAANVVYDESQVYLSKQSNVSAYTSPGSYNDDGSKDATTFWRPFNTWNAGAAGIFKCVSLDMATVRGDAAFTTPSEPNMLYINYMLACTRQSTPQKAGKLTVQLRWGNGMGAMTGSEYNSCWVGLYDDQWPHKLLARANFVNGLAEVDLVGVAWPMSHKANLGLHFPDDDPVFRDSIANQGMFAGWANCGTSPYDDRASGISYDWHVGQSLDTELIREGCSATVGNVFEPYGIGCPHPEVILPQYISGNAWAESAYMGINYLSWMEVVIGDPLMNPFHVPGQG